MRDFSVCEGGGGNAELGSGHSLFSWKPLYLLIAIKGRAQNELSTKWITIYKSFWQDLQYISPVQFSYNE